MAYVNNGTERSLKVSVNKVVGGNQVQEYPKTYDGQVSWGNGSYPTLSDDEFRQLSEGDFTDRYNAFVTYVEFVESGADFDTDLIGDAAIRTGATCLTTTSTTTFAVGNVYSFAVKYGTLPVNACTGTVALAYSSDPTPGVGTILYKDAGLTQVWNLGAVVLFVSPALYGNEVASVSTANGVILSMTGYDCADTQTTTLPVTTIPPVTTLPPTGYISWYINDITGAWLQILNSTGGVVLGVTSNDVAAQSGTITNASGVYTVNIENTGQFENIVRVRIVDDEGTQVFYSAITVSETSDTFTLGSITSASSYYVVYVTSGDVEP